MVYSIVTVMNCTRAQSSINLKTQIVVARDPLPSLSKDGTQEMSCKVLENGAAMLASDSASEMPASAVLRAAQSFAPSPHMRTQGLLPESQSSWTRDAFWSGLILAKTLALDSISFKTLFLYLSRIIWSNTLPVRAIVYSHSSRF